MKYGLMTWGGLFVFFPRLMKYMQKTIHDLVLTLQVISDTS